MAAPLRKKLVLLLKILFSAALLYFIFSKVNFSGILDILSQAHAMYLVMAVLMFIISKILSALRLNLYFHELNVPLTHHSNFRLYLLGMFYNLFLPGGIGGDAYKGYLIRQRFEVRTREIISVLLLDRLSGLLLLFVYACGLALVVDQPELQQYRIYLGAALCASVLLFWFANKQFFYFAYPAFWRSLGYSALVQLAQLICAFFILMALNVQQMPLIYLLVFLVSSIVAVLPLTVGGIGSRELVFFYGALWLGLDEHTSVGVSMVFFLITALVSLAGIRFHFRKPELDLRADG